MCLSPKTIYPLRRVSRPQGGREEEREKEEESEEKEQEKEFSSQRSLSGRPARKEGEPESVAYSPGDTHSEALASGCDVWLTAPFSTTQP